MSLETQCRQKENELVSKEAGLSSVKEKLKQVKLAQDEIAVLKEIVKKKNKQLDNLEYTEIRYWNGENRQKFERIHYNDSCIQAKIFYKKLDELHDNLIDTERKLNDEKYHFCIVIEELHDAINWLCSEIRKTFN